MTITYPLSPPSTPGIRNWEASPFQIIGGTASPFSGQQQLFDWDADMWLVKVGLPAMKRPAAEAWIAWLLALRGRWGTFPMGDPDGVNPRGTWTSALVMGAGQTGRQLEVDGMAAGVTAKAGDYLQIGTGAAARLHKVLVDAVAGGSPISMTLDIWPRLRASPGDNAAVTVVGAKGVFRMADNTMLWTSDQAGIFGISFTAVEAL